MLNTRYKTRQQNNGIPTAGKKIIIHFSSTVSGANPTKGRAAKNAEKTTVTSIHVVINGFLFLAINSIIGLYLLNISTYPFLKRDGPAEAGKRSLC